MRLLPLAVRTSLVYTEFKMNGVRAQDCWKSVRIDQCMRGLKKIKIEINGNVKI